MLSYGRNAEDVVLARVFDSQPLGFYLDVGAKHPEHGSVTKHFYDRGWCGINVIEFNPVDHVLLGEARPRDVNLRLALAGDAGAALTLADVCARHVPGQIDFLRIDADGREAEVVRGGDWGRYRPRVLLARAIEPGSAASTYGSWEPALLTAGYRFALFDGLNRFYVRAEDTALLPRLAVPANLHDDWAPHRYVSRIAELERHAASLGQHVTNLESHSAELARYVADVQEHFERCQAWAKVLERKVRHFEQHLGLLPDTLPPPRD